MDCLIISLWGRAVQNGTPDSPATFPKGSVILYKNIKNIKASKLSYKNDPLANIWIQDEPYSTFYTSRKF